MQKHAYSKDATQILSIQYNYLERLTKSQYNSRPMSHIIGWSQEWHADHELCAGQYPAKPNIELICQV